MRKSYFNRKCRWPWFRKFIKTLYHDFYSVLQNENSYLGNLIYEKIFFFIFSKFNFWKLSIFRGILWNFWNLKILILFAIMDLYYLFYYLIHTLQVALKRIIIYNILDYSIFHKVQTTCFNRFRFNPVYITIRIVPFLI